jgi:hypothetical protein
MPAGFEYEATLVRVGEDGRYRLRCRATNLSGVYELRGRRLKAVSPDNERMTGLVWEVKNRNVLLLTVHPETAAVGADYRNATLSRQEPAEGERTSRTDEPDLMIEVYPVRQDARPIEVRSPYSYKGFDQGVEKLEGKSVIDLLGRRVSLRLQAQGSGRAAPHRPLGGADFARAILEGRIVSDAKMVYHLQPNAQECVVKIPDGEGRVGIYYLPVGYVVLPGGESYWFLFGKD